MPISHPRLAAQLPAHSNPPVDVHQHAHPDEYFLIATSGKVRVETCEVERTNYEGCGCVEDLQNSTQVWVTMKKLK